MKTIKTKMIASDYIGDAFDNYDCPGHRAFKRACRKNIPWYNRLAINYGWGTFFNSDSKWESHNCHGNLINMIYSTDVGQEITFVKYE